MVLAIKLDYCIIYTLFFVFVIYYLKKLILKLKRINTQVGVLSVEYALKLRIYKSLKSSICLK